MSDHTVSAQGANRATSAAAIRRRRLARQFGRGWREFASNRSGMIGLIILIAVIIVAILAPVLVPPETLDVTKVTAKSFSSPTSQALLGTDYAGRSNLGMLVWGARASLIVGFSATIMSTVIGTLIGMAAGHFRGLTQAVLLRIIDFFLVVPSLVLAITLSSVIGASLLTIIISIGVTSWAGTARLVRSETMSIESRPYIERSWALGASNWHVIIKHVLPAVMPIVLSNTTLAIGSSIIAESTLSFLGLGDPMTISWGSILKSAMDTGAATAGYWWYVIPPGVAIVIVVLSFTLVGRALEAVINPTLREK
ncbi:MAG: ABC transporter permease [Bifidobacterium sp.]|jgi:peptide/nickel transport system permease protein|nr:ABC transporter permease [Bifidobacterium sp.]MCI1864981.1 ABC transporter permease [Bifidobacterium sp.]